MLPRWLVELQVLDEEAHDPLAIFLKPMATFSIESRMDPTEVDWQLVSGSFGIQSSDLQP